MEDLLELGRVTRRSTGLQVIQDWIYAWTLPQHLSQSRFGGRRKPSSACTIIALAMARVYHRSGMRLPEMPLSRGYTNKKGLIIPVSLLALLTNSIVDGNAVHAREMAKRQSSIKSSCLPAFDTFTIPQGIEALGRVIHEIDYRSVRGAVIAISHVANLRQFASFICQNLFPELYKMQPEQMLFEISCIQYCGPEKSNESEESTVKAHVFPRPIRLCSGEEKSINPSSSMDSERIPGAKEDKGKRRKNEG
ncbi:unnamed protein product [Angiostrongylus costaricensis]|uniref:WS_DGAT_C domain-containing protein n=1 Tax=Angiostrongylus costaricensis TaxID=334426 RepID=A0A0R3PUY8_ANGCS|nr:unnamed protein product [Angiostrongylus costaricensis]